MNIRVRFLPAMVVLLALGATCAYALPQGFARDFTYKQADGAVDIMKGDKLVARYVYNDTPKPYVYPLLSPSGLAVTRNFPMKEVAGEPKDHPHHRSMWVGFGSVNTVDFWGETEKSGKIVQTKLDFEPPTSSPYWSIHTTNDWILPSGKKLCEDDRTTAFYSCNYGTLVITSVKLIASVCDITLGDTKEGFFGIRLAPSMALKDGKGHILNSEGDADSKAWGKRARWVDYTGEVDGKVVGVAMFENSYNPGYPTYWHARDYGLLAANPIGGKAFTGDAKNDSTMKIGYTNSLTFTYTALIHDGKLDAKTLDTISTQLGGSSGPPKASRLQLQPGQIQLPEVPSRPTVSISGPKEPQPRPEQPETGASD